MRLQLFFSQEKGPCTASLQPKIAQCDTSFRGLATSRTTGPGIPLNMTKKGPPGPVSGWLMLTPSATRPDQQPPQDLKKGVHRPVGGNAKVVCDEHGHKHSH